MSEDRPDDFDAWIDVVISRYLEDEGHLALAQRLCAVANGLVELSKPQPRWDERDEVVIVPFDQADELEARLEDFLTLRAICVPVDGVPMQRELTVRVVAGASSVDVPGRAIQQTQAGVVFQLSPDAPGVQRALVSLPGALRSTPDVSRELDRRAARRPELVPVERARTALEPPSEPPPQSPPEQPRSGSEDGAARQKETDVRADPTDDIEPQSAMPQRPSFARPSTRLTQKFSLLQATEARLASESLFEVLGVHFSAGLDEIMAERDKLLEAIGMVLGTNPDDETVERVREVERKIEQAARKLMNPGKRREHRAAVVNEYKLESAVSMYEQQAETAKLRRNIEDAVAAYQRLVELCPENAEYRQQLSALAGLA